MSNEQRGPPEPATGTPQLIKNVGGVWAGDSLQNTFRREVGDLLSRQNERQFPGAQPVSFAKKHIEELKRQDYYVCEKTDGLRFLMYLTYNEEPKDRSNPEGPQRRVPAVYLIDRRNDYYWVNGLSFPHHDEKASQQAFHTETVIDGELVEDKHPDGRTELKYLAFDLLVIDKKDLRDRSLDKRLAYLKEHILKPLQKWLKEKPEMRDALPFITEDKKTEFSYSLPLMFHEIIPKVKQLHGNDGLIFTCKETKYISGTDAHILKWKPPEENTVDFLMHITWQLVKPLPEDPDQSPQEDYYAMPATIDLYIYHGRNMDYSRIGELYINEDEWEKMKARNEPLQDVIVECYLEDASFSNGHQSNGNAPPTKRWRFHRFRDDKDEANHVSTFESVKESIEDHVTEKDLLDHAEEMRAAWKTRYVRRASKTQ